MRLKAVKEHDQSTIVGLEQEIESLKSQLTDAPCNAGETSEQGTRDKEREIARLTQRLQEQDREIGKLSEAVSGWQKKYEFLSTEAPSAYQSATEE